MGGGPHYRVLARVLFVVVDSELVGGDDRLLLVAPENDLDSTLFAGSCTNQ